MNPTVKRWTILFVMVLSVVLAILFHNAKNAEGFVKNYTISNENEDCPPPSPPSENPPPNPCD